MFSPSDFPRLTEDNYEVTSKPDVNYNCIAWVNNDTERWWQPGYFWPNDAARDECGIGELEEVFRSLGYTECDDEELEAGFEKVAFYGSGFLYTHVAKQLPNGKWTSKLGKLEDITHETSDDIAGGIYGEVLEFMKRPTQQATSSKD